MKKFILILIFWLITINNVFAFDKFTNEEHELLDNIINSNLNKSKEEKKELLNQYKSNLITIQSLKKLYDKNKYVKKFFDWLNINFDDSLLQELIRTYEIESQKSFIWYWKTNWPTPLFFWPSCCLDINSLMWWDWKWIKFDNDNVIRELAIVLPKDSIVSIIWKKQIWDITYYIVRDREFDWWKSIHQYITDSRFIDIIETKEPEKDKSLPDKETILQNLKNALWSDYVRWWSYYEWIPLLKEYYKSDNDNNLSQWEINQKILKWVDCSWLLYQATNWYTPRNTANLINFWKSLDIKWKSIDEIIELVEPLDLIVWKWHVIIVLDKQHTIESRWREDFKWWVEITDIRTRLQEVFETKQPVNKYNFNLTNSDWTENQFVIKRWYN